MKKTLAVWSVLLMLVSPALAGVVKKTKSDVTFKVFGRFTSLQEERLTSEFKRVDSKNEFKGQGFLGGLAGKTLLRPGDLGEIIDLPASALYGLDHKKKEYTVSRIKQLSAETGGEEAAGGEEAERGESDIKITRNEFKVEDTGETSVINNFPVRKYAADWLTEWENVRSGEKGSTQLSSLVWTTELSDAIRQAEEEEMKFSREYMKKLGLDADKLKQDILGTSWLALLDTLNPGNKTDRDVSKFAAEINKIKGYPVVIDGKYYIKGQKAPAEAAEEEEAKDVKGVLGGFAKKMLKKKKPAEEEGREPSLAFYTEVLQLSPADLGPVDFQVPAGYKKKG